MTSFFEVAVMIYLLVVIYAANQVQLGLWGRRVLNAMLYNLLGLLALLGLSTLQLAFVPPDLLAAGMPEISPTTALIGMLLVIAGSGLGFAMLLSPRPREALRRLTRDQGIYDPESPAHLTAVVLCIALITATVWSFLLAGGQSGLVADLETSEINPEGPLFQGAIFIIAALLGVGFALRRDLPATLARLGLRAPIRDDWRAGVLSGLALYGFAVAFATIWQLLVAPEVFQEQTRAADEIARSINTPELTLIVTLSAAVGEEILIRGALQPVFGIGLSSAFFTLLHAQYLGTPTMALIFVVSCGFGLVRRRHSTTAAIIAHFIYNIVPFILNFLLVSSGGGGS
jgi:hypothetical protein